MADFVPVVVAILGVGISVSAPLYRIARAVEALVSRPETDEDRRRKEGQT